MNFNGHLDLRFRKIIVENIFDLLHKVLSLVRQLICFNVIRDHHSLRRGKLRQLYWFYPLLAPYVKYNVSMTFRVISFLDVGNIQVHSHPLHQGDQAQLNTFLAGGFGNVGSPLNLNILGVSKCGKDRHKAL